MITTTTNSIEGLEIQQYLGVVTGEAIMGASTRTNAEDRSAAGRKTLKTLQRARGVALEEATHKADDLGANAIIGLDLNYETVGASNMVLVIVSGTAIKYI